METAAVGTEWRSDDDQELALEARCSQLEGELAASSAKASASHLLATWTTSAE